MNRKDLIFLCFITVWATALIWTRAYWPNLVFMPLFALLTFVKVSSRRFAAWLETPLRRTP